MNTTAYPGATGQLSPRSSRRCSNWAGPTAATCRSISAGPAAMPGKFASTRRAGRTGAGRHRCDRQCRDGAAAAGYPHHTDRVQQRRRPGRRRLRQEHGAAGRQRHRLYSIRVQLEREMAGDAQGDRAEPDASGGPSGCRLNVRDRPVRRDPVGGVVAQGGDERDRRARRRRNRVRHRGLCAHRHMAA